jgi:hypothetical protein
MKAIEFRRAAARLGFGSPSALATALGLDRAGVWRVWHGRRPVSPALEARIAELEAELPRALTSHELRALRQAQAAGEPVPVPAPRHNFDLGVDWDSVYDGLHHDGLIEFRAGSAVLTARGADAVATYTRGGRP